ncbi:GntR family transcriptional regulator [Streptomyces sp. NPDC017966]|uniref:GntR family transcriptional regulator n=1 Tax=Streptomyces sp. NPDC017966 TaxID=3365023 RepID=UPI0037936021
MIELDRDAMTPLYVQLATVLRDRIRRGEIPVGRRLPSQAELETETGGLVSRRTIKSALEVLVDEGLVQGVQGKGVFVIALPGPPEQQ